MKPPLRELRRGRLSPRSLLLPQMQCATRRMALPAPRGRAPGGPLLQLSRSPPRFLSSKRGRRPALREPRRKSDGALQVEDPQRHVVEHSVTLLRAEYLLHGTSFQALDDSCAGCRALVPPVMPPRHALRSPEIRPPTCESPAVPRTSPSKRPPSSAPRPPGATSRGALAIRSPEPKATGSSPVSALPPPLFTSSSAK